jgi:hypothetical protein
VVSPRSASRRASSSTAVASRVCLQGCRFSGSVEAASAVVGRRGFVALVGAPDKVPPARFAQACVIAIALGLAWNPEHLAKFARQFGVNTRAIERAALRDARNNTTEPATD